MDWLRLEKALTAWSAWYRPRLGIGGVLLDLHRQEQSLYEALDCKTENLRLVERIDALERLAVVAEEACRGRAGGYWTEMRDILNELNR